METSSLQGTRVWVPCDINVWKKAEIVAKLDTDTIQVSLIQEDPEADTIVQVVNVKEVAKLSGDNAMPMCNVMDTKVGVHDMCALDHLHEPAVLENLRIRFENSTPYSFTGQICIAVNPYKWLDLYDKVRYIQLLM